MINKGDSITYPEPPEHDNLIFSKWSTPETYKYSSDTIYDMGRTPLSNLDVFANYRTINNKQYTYITVSEDTGTNFVGTIIHTIATFTDKITQDRVVTIDWGDGSTNDYTFNYDKDVHNSNTIFKMLVEHDYQEYGDYTIVVSDYFTDDYGKFKEEYFNDNSCLLFGDYTKYITNSIYSVNTIPLGLVDKFVKKIYTNELFNILMGSCGSCINLEYLMATDSGGQINSQTSALTDTEIFKTNRGIWNDSNIKFMCLNQRYNGVTIKNCHNLKIILINGMTSNIANCSMLEEISYNLYAYDSTSKSIVSRKGRTSLAYIKNLKYLNNLYIYDSVKVCSPYLKDIYTNSLSGGIKYCTFESIENFDTGSAQLQYLYFLKKLILHSNSQTANTPALTECMNLKDIVFNVSNDKNFGRLSAISYIGAEKLDLSNTNITYMDTVQNCSDLKQVIFPSGVTTVSGFPNCGIEEIVIPESVTNCGSTSGFLSTNSNLKSVKFNGSPKINYYYAFKDCPLLETIELPDSFASESTGSYNRTLNYSFQNCYKLKSIKIPANVYSIGTNCFYNCYALESVEFNNELVTISNSAFASCTSLKAVDLSKTNITKLDRGIFKGCTSLEEAILPDTITSITTSSNDGTFYNTPKLKKAWLPSSCTTIDASSVYTGPFYSGATNTENNVLDLVIYTDATEKPSGWGTYWNARTTENNNGGFRAKVYWGATKENYENGDLPPEA
jgi:hypothetical protein